MIVSESIARDMLRLVVWYPVRWVVSRLPFSWGVMFLRLMGDIHYIAGKTKRIQLLKNLMRLKRNMGCNICWRNAHVIREYFRNHYVDHLMIFLLPRLKATDIATHIELDGIHHLDRALGEKRGVILVHGHFGPVHLPLVCLSRMGYPMMQIGMPSDEGLSRIGKSVAFRLRRQYEAQLSADIIHARSFLRPVIQWLKQNGVVMITGDGTGTRDRVGRYDRFCFFGYPVLFPLGPATLSQKTGSIILPLFVLPGKNKMFRIVIEEPIQGNTESVDLRLLVSRFIRRFEYHVGNWPGYMHFLDRFEEGQWIEKRDVA
jgi:KDO2-lipid IV(A) lauroyltransferase